MAAAVKGAGALGAILGMQYEVFYLGRDLETGAIVDARLLMTGTLFGDNLGLARGMAEGLCVRTRTSTFP